MSSSEEGKTHKDDAAISTHLYSLLDDDTSHFFSQKMGETKHHNTDQLPRPTRPQPQVISHDANAAQYPPC